MKLLDESWKNWTQENIELGISKQVIFNTLKNNKFELDDITNIMGWSPSEGDTPTQPTTKMQPNVIYDKGKLSHERRFIYQGEKVEVGGEVLDIYKIDKFLTKSECEGLVTLIKKNSRKSMLSSSVNPNAYLDDTFRTSSTCDLNSKDKLSKEINERINAHMGIHALFGEPIQGQQYDETQEFKSHTDTFAPNSKEYETHCSRFGQRTWTFMIYLNETEKGGETKFPKVKTTDGEELSFTPKLGTAVVWNNLYVNGDINNYAVHQGCPVEKGEKTIITKWFRERRA
jgi:prolyl 4-hydroxylase